MEKIAIFGGTFNPVHNGHIRLASQFKEKLLLDRIIVMPTKITPNKNTVDLASDNDRLSMCQLAFESLEGFEVSDYEISCGDVSYTVKTLRYFKEKYPNAKLYFIMGSDMFLSLEKWYCFEEIFSLAVILTASREKNELQKLNSYADYLKKYNAKTIILETEPYEISSSQIRNYMKLRKDFTCYLPERVVQYIRNTNLYC